MAINAGQLREEITIRRQALNPNSSGGSIGGWVDLVTTRASVKQVSGSRNEQQNQIVHNQKYRIVMRYRIDFEVMTRLKIVHRGKDIVIHSLIEEDFKHRAYVYEGVADAKGGVLSPEIQLYEDGTIQYWEG